MYWLKKTNSTPATRSNDPFSMMDEIFKNWMTVQNENWPQSFKNFGSDFNPHLEVKETKTDYAVAVELPGMEKNDISINFENNTLYVKGEKKYQNEKKEGEKTHYSERYYGSFMRTIPFTEEIEATKIDANYNNGVLSIYLPKKPTDKPMSKTISIR